MGVCEPETGPGLTGTEDWRGVVSAAVETGAAEDCDAGGVLVENRTEEGCDAVGCDATASWLRR